MREQEATMARAVPDGPREAEDVPAGYKRTEVGLIPEDWDRARVGDVARVKGGKRLPSGFVLVDTPTRYPYLRVTDMYPGGVTQAEIRYVPEKAFSAIRNYRIYSDDIFISVAGTLGIVGVVPPNLSGASLTENADCITDIRCNRDYLMHWLMSSPIQEIIESIRTVGAQPKLALGRIAALGIAIPRDSDEQCAIAEALSDVDGLLEALDVLIAKKRTVKQAAMQQLLTGKTRLPGFGGKSNNARVAETRGREATMTRAVPDDLREAEDVPAGYKHTEVGVIPEDWDVSTVGAQFKIQLGKMLDAAKNTGVSKPYIGNRSVQWGRVDLTNLDTVPRVQIYN